MKPELSAIFNQSKYPRNSTRPYVYPKLKGHGPGSQLGQSDPIIGDAGVDIVCSRMMGPDIPIKAEVTWSLINSDRLQDLQV